MQQLRLPAFFSLIVALGSIALLSPPNADCGSRRGPAMAQPISPPLKIRVETLPLARYLRCTRITQCP